MNNSPFPAQIALCLTAAASLIFSQAVAAEPAPTSILITGATIFDGTSEKLITGKSVLIEGNKIKSIAADIKAPEGATVIDGKGRFLMPGKHFRRQAGTGCGDFPGPRIYPSGASIGQTSGHGDFRSNVDGHPYFDGAEHGGHVNQWKHTLIADGVDDVRRAVRVRARNAVALAKKLKLTILWGTDVFFGKPPFNAFIQEFAYRDDSSPPPKNSNKSPATTGKSSRSPDSRTRIPEPPLA